MGDMCVLFMHAQRGIWSKGLASVFSKIYYEEKKLKNKTGDNIQT